MRFRHLPITGGAGFVGSAPAVWFKRCYPGARITALPTLRRRGTEADLPRVRERGVEFVWAS